MTIKAYKVGGCVRDQFLGLSSKDIDFAVEAPDFETMLRWIKERGKVFLSQPEYWTVRAHLQGNQPADYVLCRKDGQYSDGRRPDSVEPGTLHDDLSRRDFTMNAIAQDEDGSYIDPFDGRGDIGRRLIRCVGTPQERFSEDALRMLRAIRFSITKHFALDEEIVKALSDVNLCDKLTHNVSTERKMDELMKCFKHDTLVTIVVLNQFTLVRDACFQSGDLWLKPTMEHP